MKKAVLFSFFFLLLTAGRPGRGNEAEAPFSLKEDRLLFTLETISVSPDERMTLSGISYAVRQNENPLYLGISAYGAVFGERGGFFTGGISGGLTGEIGWKWQYDLGLFVGGGGGGSAPQGGGLMLRPSASLSRMFDGWDIGLGVSYVHFPNGDISSSAVFLSFGIDFERAVIKGREVRELELPVSLEETGWRYSISSCFYHPSPDSSDLSGNEYNSNISMIGMEADYFPNDSLYISGRLYGAWSGKIDGYAAVLIGPCLSIPVVTNKRFRIEGGILFGASGGGGVDTGGGFILQPELGFSLLLAEGFSVQIKEGFLRTYDGELDSYVTTLGISHDFTGYTVSEKGISGLSVRTMPWRITSSVKAYIPPSGLEDKSGGDYKPGILLAGLSADRFLNRRWYISGRGYGAVTGGIGGYAEGFWGAGFVFLLNGAHSFFTELHLGAAGGGGVDVSSGFIGQGTIGYEYQFSGNTSLIARVGYMGSFNGSFRTPLAETGISFSFGQLVKP